MSPIKYNIICLAIFSAKTTTVAARNTRGNVGGHIT